MKRLQLEDVADLIYAYRPNDDFTQDEVIAQMRRWHAEVRVFRKGEILLKAGTPARHFLMLLEGTIQRRLPTPLGEDIVLGFCSPGDFFGMPAVFKPVTPHHPVDVVAHEKGIAVFFDVARVRAARRDPSLIPLFDYLAHLTAKLLVEARAHAMILTGTTIAERLRRYFSIQLMGKKSRTITVPSNEAEFAQHLGVNKCALSRTLNQLRAEGKISYRRNVITVLKM